MLRSTSPGYVSLETTEEFWPSPRHVDTSWARTLAALDSPLRNRPC
ncbi:hypothetical protein [Actinomadura litoris]|nr:hypothetical protein [Actinomadura litoris]